MNEVVAYGAYGHALGTWNLDPTATAGSDVRATNGKWFALYKRRPNGSWQLWRWIWNQPTPVPSG